MHSEAILKQVQPYIQICKEFGLHYRSGRGDGVNHWTYKCDNKQFWLVDLAEEFKFHPRIYEFKFQDGKPVQVYKGIMPVYKEVNSVEEFRTLVQESICKFKQECIKERICTMNKDFENESHEI